MQTGYSVDSDKWRNYGRSGGNCCLELIGLADHKEADCVSYSFLMRALLCEKRHDVPIRPNRPMILPKTSTIRIFTNRFGSAASARAAVEPVIPTETPQRRLQAPTVNPPQNRAKPTPEVGV